MKRWITPKQAAEYLSLHLISVYRLMAKGVIPSVRIGRSVRVDLKALDELLEKQIRGKYNEKFI